MDLSRLRLLVLAAPFFLSACGSSPDEPVPTHQTSSARSSSRVAASVAPPAVTVMLGPRASFTFARTGDGHSVTDLRSGAIAKVPVWARLRFDDTSIALDVDGIPGKAYRLYRAAFGRTPDIAGLSYWIKALDDGMQFKAIAGGFVTAPEFTLLYGANPSSAELVERMYQNVLGRQGEPAGIAFWKGLLDKKLITTTELLVGFSESAESKTATAVIAGQGIAYHEHGYFYGTLAAYEFRYRTIPTLSYKESMVDVRARLNDQGAMGYEWLRNINPNFFGRENWYFDLFAVSKPRATYLYEFRSSATRQERLAAFEELGAKGYLYKSNQWFPYNTRYDIFVKSSELPTFYRYRFQDAAPLISMIKEQGAQGYRYLEASLDRSYHVFAKDMQSDAVFEYVEVDGKKFGDGALEQLNEMGSASYAFLGTRFDSGKELALFMRSSAYAGVYTYTTGPRVYNTAEEDAAAFVQHGLNNEDYQDDYYGPKVGTVSLYAKGPPITRPAGFRVPQL